MAFLSATIDNSTRVIAVYLKEARDRSSYIIRLTLNTNSLNEVVYKFKLIVRILERVVLRGLVYYID